MELSLFASSLCVRNKGDTAKSTVDLRLLVKFGLFKAGWQVADGSQKLRVVSTFVSCPAPHISIRMVLWNWPGQ